MDRDNKSMMMVQETAPFTAVDPCSKTSCGDLKSPRAVIMTGGEGGSIPHTPKF